MAGSKVSLARERSEFSKLCICKRQQGIPFFENSIDIKHDDIACCLIFQGYLIALKVSFAIPIEAHFALD